VQRLLARFSDDESGAVLALVLVTLGVLVGVMALSMSFGLRYVTLNKLQATADAAALAGASQMTDPATVRLAANEYAEANMPSPLFRDVLADTDIIMGRWDKSLRTFNPDSPAKNAVRVVTRLATSNGNAHRDLLPGMLGAPNSVDLWAEAIAWATVSSCYSNGYVAKTTVESGSQNTYWGFCMHGQDGIKISSANIFHPGSQLSMRDLNKLVAGSDNFYNDAVRKADNEPSAANQISTLLIDFKNRKGPFPTWLNIGSVVNVNSSYSGPWTSGKYYIVNGDANIKTNISNVGIYSTKLIKIDSSIRLQNVFLASEDKIDGGSNLQIGAIAYGLKSIPPDPNGCNLISGSVFMAAKNMIKMGSNLSISGAQFISGGFYEVGSENKIHGAVGAQAATFIKFGSQEQYQACNTSNEHVLVPAGGAMLRLVN
jgi:Flp pilus assembly protein TadG